MENKLNKLSSMTPRLRIQTKPGRGGGKSLDYVDARFCMDRLDESVGPMNWKNEYKEITGQLVCGVSIFCTEAGWVTKWDVGTESNFEAEKGHFSDAFKRACVHWGIGRDLYGNVGSSLVDPKTLKIKKRYKGKTTSEDKNETKSEVVVDSWEVVEIHFGKNSGKPLGELTEQQLNWYQTKWHKGEEVGDATDEDVLLRKALDKSMEGKTKDGFKFE